MPYSDFHHLQQQGDPSVEVARHMLGPHHHMNAHHVPRHSPAGLSTGKAAAGTCGNGTGSDNENHYNLPSALPHHIQQQQQQYPHAQAPQQHCMPESHRPIRQPNRSQLSPKLRSSPIAIIHNPEDNVNQAKLRWQHPMYDTSDDEADDEDMLLQDGVSVESLTSPLDAPRNTTPQSLPTALLRAPRLGSLPSQDYRLLHLATLPPPMSLNGNMDSAIAMETDVTMTAHMDDSGQGSYAQKPKKYLSSYGSLRESHLTGRFGGAPAVATTIQAASAGHLQQPEQKLVKVQVDKTEPPATLIPPRNPLAPERTLQPPKKQPPAAKKNLSIRDRMMQKAQQQKQEASREKKKAPSSLSAMFANDEHYGNGSGATNHAAHGMAAHQTQQRTPPAPKVLPASMANAVAISYNSNLYLLAMTQSQHERQQRSSSEQLHHSQGEEKVSMVLSSSMTGLEVLRAASKARPPARPTSLSILQDSPRTMQIAQPPATTHAPPTFLQLSRSLSEPGLHPHSQQNQQTHAQNVHSALAQDSPTLFNARRIGVVRTPDGRTLIPPQSARAPAMTGLATMRLIPQPQQTAPPASAHPVLNGAGGSASLWQPPTNTMATSTMQSFGTASTQGEEPNPDTLEAFDMDLF